MFICVFVIPQNGLRDHLYAKGLMNVNEKRNCVNWFLVLNSSTAISGPVSLKFDRKEIQGKVY